MSLLNYRSKAPMFNSLGEGEHRVKLVKYMTSDSFTNYDGTTKKDLPGHSTPCPQLIITVVAVNNSGALVHRVNLSAYRKFNELTEKELKSGKFSDIDGFACIADKSGKLQRIPDEEREQSCISILDQLFHALQLPEGSGFDDLDTAIAGKTEFVVNVVNEPYDNRDQMRISKFKKVSAPVPVVSMDDDIEA